MHAGTMTSLHHDDSIEIISGAAAYQTGAGSVAASFQDVHGAAEEHTFTNMQALTPTSMVEPSASTRMLTPATYTLTTGPGGAKLSAKQTKKQKRIARAVAIVASVLILASFVLVGVTLSMADHIDEMVRRKNGYYSTPKPSLKPLIEQYNNTAG